MGAEYVLEMKNITKRYGETTVLSDVSLSVRPGEIHALLGENGAGKSTLMNVLFGMPVIHSTGGFDGEVLIGGEKANILSPNDAMNAGIGMVHQEFMLLPGFTITENIKLNREITRPGILSKALHLKNLENLDMPAMRQDARRALDSVGMNLDENTLVKGLPVGYMQFVEIAREIDKKGVKLLVFDEPTAVLTESEAAQLLKVMKDIAARGIAIIFITHRLDEVINAADGITILRRLRAAPDTAKIPVILLTAKNTEYDKVVGLDTGADDYIPKPFGMMELIARIRAVLRRTENMQDKDEPRPLVAGGICVDERAHTVFVNEQEVQLTLKEYQLLCLLMKNRGAVLTRDVLLENIWGYNNESETRTVDVHIRTLRQKLGADGALIETVRGVGYRMGEHT